MPRLVELLMLDALERHAEDAILWKIADDAAVQIEKALEFALTADAQPFQQFWHVAEDGGKITGVIHAMMLPVPPIYAGAFGEPGLILPDSFVVADAPGGTAEGLLAAAERALDEAGARIKLASYVAGDVWRTAFEANGYEPLTLYLSRSDLGDQGIPDGIRQATEADVPGIVARSAENRQVLFGIDPFWEIHPEADPRFAAWMMRSLTLRDRDMMVMGPPDDLAGYVIAQPASRLHFPAAHDIAGTGVIDDYYHPELANPVALDQGSEGANALLRAAEAAFANRGMGATFVVCPAGWTSKVALLEAAGYQTAMVWSRKR
ncbi:hypothetical protein RA29_00435 [Tateyamaria sp. ANG-S1]|nr:hypothetical protein RA29_00435 [Tateyamaria sp. ANG-S1]